MSTCSAAEIAEKKRIALERLNARKQAQTSSSGKTIQVSTPKLSEKLVKSFYSSSTSKVRSSTAVVENKASTFINALKQNCIFPHRKDIRDSAHPYHRPAANNDTTMQRTKKEATKELAPVFLNTFTCKPYVISNTRFVVAIPSSHTKLIDIFNTIPSKSYDKHTQLWSFDLKEYKLWLKSIECLSSTVFIVPIPRSVLNLCLTPIKLANRSCLASIDSTLTNKLLPFQEESVCFSIAQYGRIMICDEMGLGKTYQALAIADFYKQDWPLLVCTTASTRESWSNHVRELLPTVAEDSIQVLTNNQQYFGNTKVLITSYNMMERLADKLLEHQFRCLIFDESHMLKNNKAKCTIAANRFAKLAKHVILLSGTPALSRPLELFTQLQLIENKFLNFMEFTKRYCDGKYTDFGWDASGQSNLEELNAILKLKYMIRRTKADVLPEMAEKFRETVVLDPALIWNNDDAKATLSKFTREYSKKKGKEREEILLAFYARTAAVKTHAVCEHIRTLLRGKTKFIVFAHHHTMMAAITDFLNELDVDFVRIDGSTRAETRGEYIERFQTNESCKVAVLSLRACSAGITLTAAEIIVFAELDWNPSTLAQAESRAHRIGQLKPVTCRYLMASETADDIIWPMLKNKQDTLNKAGLFCEDLQQATHTTAFTTSRSINQFFQPVQSNTSIDSNPSCEEIKSLENKATPLESVNTKNSIVNNEWNNIDKLFDDDDDDVFKDLQF